MKKELRDIFMYIPSTGEVYINKKNQTKKILPDEDGNLNVVVDKKRIKMKYSFFVWCLISGAKPNKNETIWFKDLDQNNFAFNNLMLVQKDLYSKLIEAMKNLSGDIKLYPHPSDGFSYVLEYRQGGRTKKDVYGDITIARKEQVKLKLSCAKFLSIYTITA